MPYINRASLMVRMETKDYLDSYRESDEPWDIYLRALLDNWLKNN